jgi:hypothetical protein
MPAQITRLIFDIGAQTNASLARKERLLEEARQHMAQSLFLLIRLPVICKLKMWAFSIGVLRKPFRIFADRYETNVR